MDQKTIEEYLEDGTEITHQKLIDKGVIPKTAGEMLSLITYRRLESLRDMIAASVDEETLGTWLPAIRSETTELHGKIDDPEQIKKYARIGMKIVGKGVSDRNNIDGLNGKIVNVRKGGQTLDIEFDVPEGQRGFHDLRGQISTNTGYTVLNSHIDLILDEPIEVPLNYQIAEGVVANKSLGHKIRFNKEYEGPLGDKDGGNLKGLKIPKGAVGTFQDYDERRKEVRVKLDERPNGKNSIFKLPISYAHDYLEASSLGQETPKDMEDAIRKQTLLDFFPTTKLDPELSRKIVTSMLMESHMIFGGPPGSGKSQLSKDIMRIYNEHIGLRFKIKGDIFNTNPFSITDEKFAKKVKPSIDSILKLDPNGDYMESGFFNAPKPKDIPVTIQNTKNGFGALRIPGISGLTDTDIIGVSIPGEDNKLSRDYDPERFNPGKFGLGNNGIIVMEETDKLRQATRDVILTTAEEGVAITRMLNHETPASSVIIQTTNQVEIYRAETNDRFAIFYIPHASDVDIAYDITKIAVFKEHGEVNDVEIGDVHTMQPLDPVSYVTPMIIDKAVDNFLIKFRTEYEGKGKNKVTSSGRAKKDALIASRCGWLIDHLFLSEITSYPDETYAMQGLSHAFTTRVQQDDEKHAKDAYSALTEWITENFPKAVKDEQKNWWCQAYKAMAIRSKTVSESIEGNFQRELATYEVNRDSILRAYEKVKNAYENLHDKESQTALIEFPMMNYLFEKQLGFKDIRKFQIEGVVSYFVNCKMSADEVFEEESN